MESRPTFSKRYGYQPQPPITVREDAPIALRVFIFEEMQRYFEPKGARTLVCKVLRMLPNEYNWSDEPVWNEVRIWVYECQWPKVYDIVEAMYRKLEKPGSDAVFYREGTSPDDFENDVNSVFEEHGIGWRLAAGYIETRGTESFQVVVTAAGSGLAAAGLTTASSEIHEAIQDLSRRPTPDLTGAIQHAIAALECVAREASGDAKATLGEIIKNHPGLIPRPLDISVDKAWGYASEMGRHINEGRTPEREEVELIVGIAATVATYLTQLLERRRRER
jgi:AbiJ N-terminal domain 4